MLYNLSKRNSNEPAGKLRSLANLRRGKALFLYKIWRNLWRSHSRHTISGRYGGTYAHADIAFEFTSWISDTKNATSVFYYFEDNAYEQHSHQTICAGAY